MTPASCHWGVCRACAVDIRTEKARAGDGGGDIASVIPKRSFLNSMDPMYRFPRVDWLRELFRSLSLAEALLLALEHMQISYVTIASTGLAAFTRNVISFPQSFPEFAKRVGLLAGFRVGDRVNAVRGPGADMHRAPVPAASAP